MRYAIWTAVSTRAQAAQDKVSLVEQETKCRAYAAAQGWRETAGPFVANGYSRTGYSDLSDALIDIPPLRDLFDHIGQIDLLLMYSYDRMGDVLPMLAVKFKQHRKQILSVSQPAPVQLPAHYDPYNNEGADIMQDVARITQRFRINDIRRKWNAGIPARVDRGLHPLSIPYGYAAAEDGQPVQLVPEQAALLQQMKDWFLTGSTYADICRRADQILPPPRAGKWAINVVRRMLTNPFYAGIVAFGRLRTVNGRRVPQPRSEWKTAPGQHTPLWDASVHRAILDEYQRRIQMRRHHVVKYPFSGLTVCAICDGKISRHGSRYKYLACSTSSKHWHMNYAEAEDLLARALVQQLKEYQLNPPASINTADIEAQLKEQTALRARIQAGYEGGLYSMSEAMRKLSALDETIQKYQEQLLEIEENLNAREQWQDKMGGLQGAIDGIPYAIQHGDPARLNQLLSALIRKITLYPDNSIKFTWRG